jgi:hypothetical protein
VATKEVEHAIIVFLEKPQIVEKVLKSEDEKKWEISMQEKYDSFVVNNTWSLVPLSKGKKPISCKWVFKIKHGSMVKSNVTRLDLWQKVSPKHLEFITIETFALVAKFVSICYILALTAIENMEIHQMDVKTTFFNGDLE